MIDIHTATVCIVGAAGQMGTLFRTLWSGKFKELRALDLKEGESRLTEEQIESAIPGSDIVIFSVPIKKLDEVVASVAPHLPENCVVTDFSSVKMIPMEIFERDCPVPIVGAHPLFGPESMECLQENSQSLDTRLPQNGTSAQEKRVAIIPGKRAEPQHVSLVEELFRQADCATFICSANEHDRAMATIQGLNFISNLAYFSTSADLPDLDKFITPSFQRRLNAAKSMLTDDAELFMNIARHTPQLREALQEYSRALEKAAELDGEAVTEMLALARKYFSPGN